MKIDAKQAPNFIRHCELLAHFMEDSKATIISPFFEGLRLYQALRRLENKAHYAAERYCNGDISEQEFDEIEKKIMNRLREWLPNAPSGVFVNGDPRGYALKIDNPEPVRELNLYRDLGGYGILAPEF